MSSRHLYQGIFIGVFLGYVIRADWSWPHAAHGLLAAIFVLVGWLVLDLIWMFAERVVSRWSCR